MKFIRSAITLIKNETRRNVLSKTPFQARYLSMTPIRLTDKKENVTYCSEVGVGGSKAVVSGGYQEIKGKQAEFQDDDGIPIFLKGPSDKYLYKGTLFLAIIGLLYTLKFISSLM